MSMMKKILILISFLLIWTLPAAAQEGGGSAHTLEITEWLVLDPVEAVMPLWHDQPDVNNNPFTASDLLSRSPADDSAWLPAGGEAVRWASDASLRWREVQGDAAEFEFPGSGPAYGWAAFYVETDRFTEASLSVSGSHPFLLIVNGEQQGVKSGSEGPDDEPGSLTRQLTLTQGKHTILIRTLYDPEAGSPWALTGSIEAGVSAGLAQSTDPRRTLDLETLSNQPQLGSLAVSADGSLAALRIQMPSPPDGTGDSWLEIRNTSDGSLYREYRGGKDFGSLQWAPEGKAFTYTESENGKTSIWLADLESGSQQRILKDVEQFAGYRWSPEGSFIIYSVNEQKERDGTGVYRIDDLEERRPWHFTRSFLYKLNVPEGTTQRLTAGLLATSLHDISPDGETLLFSRSHTDYSQRPYSVTEYRMLNLRTMQADSLFTVPFGGSGSFSPDGESILFTGGPSMFGELGTNVPEGMVANDYDTQAYLYGIESGDITPITRSFDPQVNQVRWGADTNTIYLTTTDRSYGNLYRYDLRRDRYTLIETDTEVINQFDLSRNGRTAVYSGTGISQPVQAHVLDLRRDRTRLLRDPGSGYFAHVEFGEDKEWSFTTDEGREIDGYVYYPPNFNPDNTYPVIAHYYGGTVPVSRAFGGRYPKELYAAKGYIVYVMQPSGATGYGQEFSALHVNDWGKIVSGEIIQAVDQFLDAHPYADRERVGAIGASYGGFMTMLLLTETDMFAAGVSHAGISNIASYWGEGFWGFQYSAIATANSFPWNRKDIYIDQSPLYAADQVTTPLLFVTGMSDTNVPPGESLQMYTALKLLEREAAFVAVDGQDHHILDYNKYKLWKQSILAWFDKYLKDQPEWWDHKYE
jgi:dipeptidyl aminopeptidase/acylaminoacyl peptidase